MKNKVILFREYHRLVPPTGVFQAEMGGVVSESQEAEIMRLAAIIEEDGGYLKAQCPLRKEPPQLVLGRLANKDHRFQQLLEAVTGAVSVPLSALRRYPALKALFIVERKQLKTNEHTHFSWNIDGAFVEQKLGLKAPFNFSASKYHNNDDWIKNIDDMAEGFRYVLRQLAADGINSAPIRFNPYKLWGGDNHHARLEAMASNLSRIQVAIRDESQKLSAETGINYNFTMLLSINRGKYSGSVMLDIINQLGNIIIKNHNLRISALDISGPEMLSWEWDIKNNEHTKLGKQLFEALNTFHQKTGVPIAAHLTDFNNLNPEVSNLLLNKPVETKQSILSYLKSYLTNIPSLSRIGHASVIRDPQTAGSRLRSHLAEVISLLMKRNILLERCYLDKKNYHTLQDIRQVTPVYEWDRLGLNYGFGMDGPIYVDNRSLSDSPAESATATAVSFSQWRVLAWLARPAGK
ncbi:MAG: hypothetical protein ABIH39_08175 [Candidatus Margulisiibacteriota bacterium]